MAYVAQHTPNLPMYNEKSMRLTGTIFAVADCKVSSKRRTSINRFKLVLLRSTKPCIYSLVFFVFVVFADQASTQCVDPPENGNWINADSNTRSLTRAELRFTCQDQILNGQPYPPGPPWHICGASAAQAIATGEKSVAKG